jgi:hypothetical protein
MSDQAQLRDDRSATPLRMPRVFNQQERCALGWNGSAGLAPVGTRFVVRERGAPETERFEGREQIRVELLESPAEHRGSVTPTDGLDGEPQRTTSHGQDLRPSSAQVDRDRAERRVRDALREQKWICLSSTARNDRLEKLSSDTDGTDAAIQDDANRTAHLRRQAGVVEGRLRSQEDDACRPDWERRTKLGERGPDGRYVGDSGDASARGEAQLRIRKGECGLSADQRPPERLPSHAERRHRADAGDHHLWFMDQDGPLASSPSTARAPDDGRVAVATQRPIAILSKSVHYRKTSLRAFSESHGERAIICRGRREREEPPAFGIVDALGAGHLRRPTLDQVKLDVTHPRAEADSERLAVRLLQCPEIEEVLPSQSGIALGDHPVFLGGRERVEQSLDARVQLEVLDVDPDRVPPADCASDQAGRVGDADLDVVIRH